MASMLSAHIGSSLAASCEGSTSSVLGSYRLMENESVKPSAIAEAGFQATVVAAHNTRRLLALEDSSTLGYSHSVRTELGDLGGPEDSKTRGFWTHTVMLLDAETERTVGLIEQERWKRDMSERGKKNQRKQRPYEEKESFKWQKSSENMARRLGDQMTKVISVCDREADVFEYVQYKLTNRQSFVVRATQNRILIGEDELLFDSLAAMPTLGTYTITVPQRGGRRKRKTTLVSDTEWKVLWITQENKPLPKVPPSLIWFLHTVARLGGWCDSKRTGNPGWLAVWKGWSKLQDRVKTFHQIRAMEI